MGNTIKNWEKQRRGNGIFYVKASGSSRTRGLIWSNQENAGNGNDYVNNSTTSNRAWYLRPSH